MRALTLRVAAQIINDTMMAAPPVPVVVTPEVVNKTVNAIADSVNATVTTSWRARTHARTRTHSQSPSSALRLPRPQVSNTEEVVGTLAEELERLWRLYDDALARHMGDRCDDESDDDDDDDDATTLTIRVGSVAACQDVLDQEKHATRPLNLTWSKDFGRPVREARRCLASSLL